MIRTKSTRTTAIIIGAVAVTTAITIGLSVWWFGRPADGLALEANATLGMLPGIDPAQRLKELQDKLDESMIAFSVNTSPVFNTAGEGNLMVENPANNGKLLTAELVLGPDEQVLYTSGALVPGSYLETVKLDSPLAPGTYSATVYLKAYRESDQSFIGQTGAQITLLVTA